MPTMLLIRAGWSILCLLTLATVSFSQTPQSATEAPSPTPTPTPSSTPLRIIYTGKFLGYLRVPSLQPINVDPTLAGKCPDPSSQDSDAAIKFLAGPADPSERKKYESAIRVSTGDNFAPQLEARVFDFVQPNPNKYKPGNKELYDWFNGNWVRAKEDLSETEQQLLERQKAFGSTTIPTDNVACFLTAAGYRAVVPGKHDFYFGAERVRQLARFMASIDQKGYQPVQMLGANLVIKTAPVTSPASSAQKPKSKWPDDSAVQTLKEGMAIYPWFSTPVRINVSIPETEQVQKELKAFFPATGSLARPALETFLDQKSKDQSLTEAVRRDWSKLLNTVKTLDSISVCPTNDLSEITKGACDNHGWKPAQNGFSMPDRALVYSISVSTSIPPDRALAPGKDQHYATFEPGKNYGLCQRDPKLKGADDIEARCLTFPIYRPFFHFPRAVPLTGTDPDPFVFLRNGADPSREVAIFGVVDPNISEEVGLLNFSWQNEDSKLKTLVSAEDPAEALKQQLDYFAQWYKANGWGTFSGLKILLAQMSPQRARVLAARSRDFQLVVAAADEEQGTSETILSTVWNSDRPAGTFVAVPLPYFDSKTQSQNLEGTLHLGMIEASPHGRSWNIDGSPLKQLPIPEIKSGAVAFWKQVAATFPECLTDGFSLKSDKQGDRLKWLTLCAMRERLGADVALLQKRDFFNGTNETGGSPADFQQVLDRLIWKGDLLTLMYVPGSALKKALDQSKKFDTDDSNALSLSNEKQRGLETLGIKKTDKDVLINEAPLDEKKRYAVATTDYIGAGDTGYPDLAAAALDPKTRPSQFPDKLEPISAVVCRKLFADDYQRHCLPEIVRNNYLDPIAAKAPPSPPPPGFGNWLRDRFPFKWPDHTSLPEKTLDALNQKVQQRWIRTLSLRNFSFGLLNLSNNLTDAQLGQKFAGVSTSGVTAKKARTVTLGLDTRVSLSSHRNEFFVAMGIDYNEVSTGDVSPKINQLKNRLTADAGVIWNIRGGRSKDRVGITSALHVEMPLQRPFTSFTLGTQDSLKITQNRSVLLLPRVGLRWQNGASFFEVGGQVGREIHALSGYRFNTTTLECLPSATQTFAACITKLSTPPMTAITKDSMGTAILQSRPRAGLYWKYGLSIPFGSKVKYELNQEENQEADFFFDLRRDNSTDTRFLDRSKHSIKFIIWPSFSIGPTLRLLLYQNKVNRDFLFQKQFGLEANVGFDLFNRREKSVQLKHKP